MATSRDDLEKGLDALYAAPLPEFVGARDALAKSLAAAGRKEDAARVRALKKPGAAAWAVNRLAFVAPRLLAALVASGDRLRKDPSRAPSAMSERRAALNGARVAAERELVAGGHAAAPEVLRRVAATLEAVAAYGSAPGRPVAGRLTEDVSAPGFDEIAALGLLGGSAGARRAPLGKPEPARPPAPPRAPTARDRAREAANERALEEKRRREARKALERRAAEARAARSRRSAAEKALQTLRSKRTGLEASLAAVVGEERKLEEALAEARAASDAADAAEREAHAFTRG